MHPCCAPHAYVTCQVVDLVAMLSRSRLSPARAAALVDAGAPLGLSVYIGARHDCGGIFQVTTPACGCRVWGLVVLLLYFSISYFFWNSSMACSCCSDTRRHIPKCGYLPAISLPLMLWVELTFTETEPLDDVELTGFRR
eukprot:360973-Chlamydomonas_euryale.AAC.7